MIPAEHRLRRQIVETCRLLYLRGYISATDGNVSARSGPKHLLCTPSGVHKGRLQEGDLVKTDCFGRAVESRQRVTSEIRMHLAVYEERADVQAIVHAHPAYAIALSVAGVSLEPGFVSESVIALGTILTVPYSSPTTADVAAAVRPYVSRTNALILERHGTLTLGGTVEQAYIRTEILEHTAKIVAIARAVGGALPLADEEVARLRDIAVELGVEPLPDETDDVVQLVAERVLRRLKG